MAVSAEVVTGILRYHPEETVVGGEKIHFGQVDSDIDVVFGNFEYPKRFVEDPTEPLVIGRTIQPVVALEQRDGDGEVIARSPLAYRTDISTLREGLAEQVLFRIAVYQLRAAQQEIQEGKVPA